jgi:hypothetical protein
MPVLSEKVKSSREKASRKLWRSFREAGESIWKPAERSTKKRCNDMDVRGGARPATPLRKAPNKPAFSSRIITLLHNCIKNVVV